MAMTSGFREAIHAVSLGVNILDRDVGRTRVNKDNQGAIHLTKSLWPLPAVSTLMSVITSFGMMLLAGSSTFSTHHRHCGMPIFSPSLSAHGGVLFSPQLCDEFEVISSYTYFIIFRGYGSVE